MRLTGKILKLKSGKGGRQRGTIMALTAIMIASLIGLVALAIDLGYLFSLKNQYANGIDAAALAAASQLRVTIEGAGPNGPQQLSITRVVAKNFAAMNEIRLRPDPPVDPNAPPLPNANAIHLEDAAITVDATTDIPRVTVDSSINAPTLFAGIVGFYNVKINAKATASLFPVDGGTGTLSAGTDRNSGCWRPIMLPDTFNDAAEIPHVLFEGEPGAERLPNQAGDYYRSRFAAGGRNIAPFVDAAGPIGLSVTGLRDTSLITEVGLRTIMGQQMVKFRRDSYFVANFAAKPNTTIAPLNVNTWANFGYCGTIRVEEEIPVFPRGDAAAVDQVRLGLEALLSRTLALDQVNPDAEASYKYVASTQYPEANTHGAIIPVLFYDPFLYTNANPGVLKVTNIGLFMLKLVEPNGDLTGYFVREIFSGGTPVAVANSAADSPSFQRNWLPMSVHLLK